MPPGAAAGEHGGEHRPIVQRCPSAALWPHPEPGQQRFDDPPQRIRHQSGDNASTTTFIMSHRRTDL